MKHIAGIFAAARALGQTLGQTLTRRYPPGLTRIPRLAGAMALAGAGLALSLHAPLSLAQTVELTNVPMATSTVTTVKPNLMFVLDDSGSMAWDYMPDAARNFSGKYGYNTNHCNGVYYNPNVTYLPPVNGAGAPLNATATTFTAAYRNGYATGNGTVNLSTGFTGGSGSGSSGINLTAGPAFYYTYSGNQTTEAKKKYSDTNSNFYKECNSAPGSTTVIDGAAVNTRFTLTRLAVTPTTTITVSSVGGAGAVLTITGASSRSKFSNITVGGAEIMSSESSRSSTPSTIAANIASRINDCTTVRTGNCAGTGYAATVNGTVITITGPAAAAGLTANVTRSGGDATFTITAFPAASATTVSSVAVASTQLLSANATGSTAPALAADIAAKINANTTSGYTATVAGTIVTVTGPAAASTLTPTMTVASGTMTLTTQAFPESTPAKLQNFANWYSYYSHRMLMMKTGAGLAFANVSDKFRVGFLTMNNNVSPGIVESNTFTGAQRTAWYNKLYAASPGNSTPLREALSRVGQYYANKFGNVTRYSATITVGGAGNGSVQSILVNGVEILGPDTPDVTSTSTLATEIANSINGVQVTDFGASAVGNVITLTGPASAVGYAPLIDSDGTMTYTTTSFSGTTTTSTLNGIVPADPIQFSCQQNFTILSTDGYWNGANTYNLSGGAVGQQDGVGVPRPLNDGSQLATTYNYIYTRNSLSRTSSGCSSGRNLVTQPQEGSCSSTSASGGCSPSSWSDVGTPTTGTGCNASSPSPATTTPVLKAGSPVSVLGTVNGPSNTLADVAMYYYQTDLRDNSLGNCTGALGTSVCEDIVFATPSDNNVKQHMTTFTLGLGARGTMVYSPTYLTDTTGDFFAVKQGSIASAAGGICTWQTDGTVCNWPVPVSGTETTIDDLWHAAVNGRGAYFSATDPATLASGLADALTSINSKVGAAAAAAASSLNPVAGNNTFYVASYVTQAWTGNLEARGVNTDTGAVNENATWCLENVVADTCVAPSTVFTDTSGDTTAVFCSRPNSTICTGGTLVGSECRIPMATSCTGTMPGRVSDLTDSRTIYTAKNDGLTLVPFDATYRAANATFFNATTLAGLSQWPPASDTSSDANYFRANAIGDNLLKYVRGQWGNEYGRVGVASRDQFYRARSAVMGDALESQPVFVGAPLYSYGYQGYAEFKTAQTSRNPAVYMGVNDGMLHAFSATSGAEIWAYIPSMVVPNLWRLADQQYGGKHVNFLNGSSVITDICTSNCSNTYSSSTPGTNPVWKTILVAGLAGGGRGYFALDITNPSAPALLWEFTTTTGLGKTKDDDLGFSYGEPVVTRKNDGTWVIAVTSGYDNGSSSPVKNATSGTFVANSPAGSGKGYLFVLNAATGAMISKIDTGVGTAASPSGLAKIGGFNADPTGNRASYVYGGDLLGNLWRFDINSSTAAAVGTGSVLKLASLYSDSGGTIPQPITTTPAFGLIDNKKVIFIGTGKYLETSDLATTQKQSFYAIKDDGATSTLVNPRTTLIQQYLVANPNATATRVSSGTPSGVTAINAVSFSSGNGWFVDFPDTRERANIDPQLVLGALIIPTIVPSASDCSPGGSGWLNVLDYKTGGLIPLATISSVKTDAPIVGVNVTFIDGNPILQIVKADDKTPQKVEGFPIQSSPATFTGTRVLWRELLP